MVGGTNELEPFVELDSRRPEGLHACAHRDGAVVADRLSHGLDRLEPEARAVLEGAAVLVGPPVVERREELERQVAVPAVDVDDVEPRLARAEGRAHPVLADARDVGELHRLGHEVRLVVARKLGRGHRGEPRLAVDGMPAGVGELDPREGAVLVHALAHDSQVREIVVVPETGGHVPELRRSPTRQARTRCRPPPILPRPSWRGTRPGSRASPSRSRCSAARRRSDSAGSSGRS